MNIKAAYMVPHPPLIVPEVGKGEEKKIQATIEGYKKIAEEIQQLAPDTIVVISPHSVMYADYFHISPGNSAKGDFSQFGAPQVAFQVQYDKAFADHLTTISEQNDVAAGFLGERDPRLDHGMMVPLYFIKEACGGHFPSQFVRIGLSGLSFEAHYKVGQLIQKTARALGRKIVLIASGDLSHRLKEDGPYGYKKEGPVYDEKIMTYAAQGDFLSLLMMGEDFCELAGECGHRSLCIMAGALDGIEVKATPLSYEGTFGVGYGIVSFHPTGLSEARKYLEQVIREKKRRLEIRKAQEDDYVKLARKSLEEYIRTGRKIAVPADVAEELLNRQAGCFVSLKKEGKLRGCIGTIAPTKASLAEEIIENAINAAVSDPRFEPVAINELDFLEYSVDVLGEAEAISSPSELDVKKYGVIVSKGYKRGLLLPNLEGIDTVEEQIHIAMQKAGIPEGESVQLERFEVVRHF
ncbi:MAG: AmmeMemoRadiSam system protein A [Lachnospiraceae bacterium]|nr:AmmeMemoRadiSam system protein A [Lachnospiraceae bacterium]